MTDIEVVIKMPEDVFKRTVFYREFRSVRDCIMTIKALEKATPLPKGHGRLIDADAFISFIEDVSKRHEYENLRVDGIITVNDVLEAVIGSLQNEGLSEGNTPTIIEAESEE